MLSYKGAGRRMRGGADVEGMALLMLQSADQMSVRSPQISDRRRCPSLSCRTSLPVNGERDAGGTGFADRQRRRLTTTDELRSSPRLRGEGAGRRMRGGAGVEGELLVRREVVA